MRKSLADIQEIDRYLLQETDAADRFLFQVRMVLDASLRRRVAEQRRIHQLLKTLGREARRRELMALHEQLLQDTTFQQELRSIFP